jgi:hypothetical protein
LNIQFENINNKGDVYYEKASRAILLTISILTLAACGKTTKKRKV